MASAQQHNASDDRWYRMDMTHASFAAVREACRTRHALSQRAGVLSIRVNNAGTEALVKVADAGSWVPPPAAVVRIYIPSDHGEAQTLAQAPAWNRPDPL